MKKEKINFRIFKDFRNIINSSSLKPIAGPGAVAQACNPTLWETEVGGSQGQEFKTRLANIVKPHLY